MRSLSYWTVGHHLVRPSRPPSNRNSPSPQDYLDSPCIFHILFVVVWTLVCVCVFLPRELGNSVVGQEDSASGCHPKGMNRSKQAKLAVTNESEHRQNNHIYHNGSCTACAPMGSFSQPSCHPGWCAYAGGLDKMTKRGKGEEGKGW